MVLSFVSVLLFLPRSERLAEFVESEAELSGEDVGPDEDDKEEGDEEDMLNQYLAEEEDLGMSKQELRDQVAKAHMYGLGVVMGVARAM